MILMCYQKFVTVISDPAEIANNV